jgi:PAS domain-containing protein
MPEDRIQTSLRLPRDLYRQARRQAIDRRQNINAVIQSLIEQWVASRGESEPAPFDRSPLDQIKTPDLNQAADAEYGPHDLLRAYIRCIPAEISVKELHGRIIGANDNFFRLIGRRNVIGQSADDYLPTAAAAYESDAEERVRSNRKPVVCVEEFEIGSEITRRITIRFPIFNNRNLELTGALGFNVSAFPLYEDLRAMAKKCGGIFRIPTPSLRSIEVADTFHSDSLLKAFVESLPAIATVKNLEGRLRCINSEYSRVTGKSRDDVLNRLPGDNWPVSPTGELIAVHDRLVRETMAPFMTVDTLRFADGRTKVDRLNIRFPIFHPDGSLIFTGSFGFDLATMLEALKSRSHSAPQLCFPLSDADVPADPVHG